MKIVVGISNQTEEILEDLEKAKACNFCIKFTGYGLHWFSGYCGEKKKELSSFDYKKEAIRCKDFICDPKFLRK